MKLLMMTILTMLLAISVVAGAQTGVETLVAPPEIPVYGQAELVTEVNISDQAILGYMRMGMQAFGASSKTAEGEIGSFVKAIDLETLASAISGLKYIRLLQFKIAQPDDPLKILDFYTQNVGQNWQRVLWDISQPGRAFMVMMRPGGSEVIAVAVMNEKPIMQEKVEGAEATQPEPLGQRLVVSRTVGMVDVEKLGSWSGKLIVKISQMQEQQRKKLLEAEAVKKVVPKPQQRRL